MEPVQEQAARKASSSSFSFSYFSIDFTDVHKEATQSGKEDSEYSEDSNRRKHGWCFAVIVVKIVTKCCGQVSEFGISYQCSDGI